MGHVNCEEGVLNGLASLLKRVELKTDHGNSIFSSRENRLRPFTFDRCGTVYCI